MKQSDLSSTAEVVGIASRLLASRDRSITNPASGVQCIDLATNVDVNTSTVAADPNKVLMCDIENIYSLTSLNAKNGNFVSLHTDIDIDIDVDNDADFEADESSKSAGGKSRGTRQVTKKKKSTSAARSSSSKLKKSTSEEKRYSQVTTKKVKSLSMSPRKGRILDGLSKSETMTKSRLARNASGSEIPSKGAKDKDDIRRIASSSELGKGDATEKFAVRRIVSDVTLGNKGLSKLTSAARPISSKLKKSTSEEKSDSQVTTKKVKSLSMSPRKGRSPDRLSKSETVTKSRLARNASGAQMRSIGAKDKEDVRRIASSAELGKGGANEKFSVRRIVSDVTISNTGLSKLSLEKPFESNVSLNVKPNFDLILANLLLQQLEESRRKDDDKEASFPSLRNQSTADSSPKTRKGKEKRVVPNSSEESHIATSDIQPGKDPRRVQSIPTAGDAQVTAATLTSSGKAPRKAKAKTVSIKRRNASGSENVNGVAKDNHNIRRITSISELAKSGAKSNTVVRRITSASDLTQVESGGLFKMSIEKPNERELSLRNAPTVNATMVKLCAPQVEDWDKKEKAEAQPSFQIDHSNVNVNASKETMKGEGKKEVNVLSDDSHSSRSEAGTGTSRNKFLSQSAKATGGLDNSTLKDDSSCKEVSLEFLCGPPNMVPSLRSYNSGDSMLPGTGVRPKKGNMVSFGGATSLDLEDDRQYVSAKWYSQEDLRMLMDHEMQIAMRVLETQHKSLHCCWRGLEHVQRGINKTECAARHVNGVMMLQRELKKQEAGGAVLKRGKEEMLRIKSKEFTKEDKKWAIKYALQDASEASATNDLQKVMAEVRSEHAAQMTSLPKSFSAFFSSQTLPRPATVWRLSTAGSR